MLTWDNIFAPTDMFLYEYFPRMDAIQSWGIYTLFDDNLFWVVMIKYVGSKEREITKLWEWSNDVDG